MKASQDILVREGEYITLLASSSLFLYGVLGNGGLFSTDFMLQSHSLVFNGDQPIIGLSTLPSSNFVVFGDVTGVVRYGDPSRWNTFTIGSPLSSLSLAPDGYRLAVGTELADGDAGVQVFDLRNTKEPLVKYMDSHNDDVTDVRFHPSQPNKLVSGSTDGIVNVYDLNITDESEAVTHAFNHDASIHRCGFLDEPRVFALSHMETLAVYEATDENTETKDFGDLREAWNCQYVADYDGGCFLVGSNDNQWLKLIPFQDEQPMDPINLEGGHGEEVVRAFAFHPTSPELVYTAGEDGHVKLWTTPMAKTAKIQRPRKRHVPY